LGESLHTSSETKKRRGNPYRPRKSKKGELVYDRGHGTKNTALSVLAGGGKKGPEKKKEGNRMELEEGKLNPKWDPYKSNAEGG